MEKNHYSIISVLILAVSSHFVNTSPVKYGATDFDYLMLDQHWPISECLNWKGLNITHTCSLPETQNAFTVHGLWPTKTGTKGPHSCSNQPRFDRKALDPILNRLNQRWFNVHGGTDSYGFWEHEWNKHGTCAQVLEPFNSVLKYFNGTLNLNASYDIYAALAEYGILPGDRTYALDDILAGLMKKFGKSPQIYCTFNKGQALIHSVKLCLDKTLKLIDCSSVGVVARNCGGRNSLKYLKDLPGK